jgi:hypothetical protein
MTFAASIQVLEPGAEVVLFELDVRVITGGGAGDIIRFHGYRFDSMLRAYRLAGVQASRKYAFESVVDAEKLTKLAITGPLRVPHFTSISGGRGTGATQRPTSWRKGS